MATIVNRGLSLLVFLGYVAFAYFVGTGLLAAKVAVALLLPMGCIWFPEALGSYSGTMRLHTITGETPAFLVCAAGWMLLVGIPVIGYFLTSGT